MSKLDAIGEQAKIALGGFLMFLLIWAILTFTNHLTSDFAKFIMSCTGTLWSILLFVIDPRSKKQDVPPADSGAGGDKS